MKNAKGKQPDAHNHVNMRSVTSGFMAAILALSAFMGSGVTTAYAASSGASPTPSNSTAVISLTDADHGTLAFSDTDERSKTVETGTVVTVDVEPEKGYTTGSLGVIDEDGNVTAAPVSNGEANVKVDKNVTVIAAFYAKGGDSNQNAEAFSVLDTSAGKAKTAKSMESTKDYILSHMDKKYTGNGSELTISDLINTTITVADGTKLEDKTLDGLWVDKDGDGYSDTADAMINQTVVYVPLYSVSNDGDYFVGRVGTDISNAKVTDWGAAANNGEAQMFDDVVFDEDTGLVYVPKSHLETNKDGDKLVLSTRIQMLYVTDGAVSDSDVNLNVEVNSKGVSGKVLKTGEAGASLYAVGTEIQLAKDDESLGDITADTIDSVEINGIEYTSDMNAWSYDEEKGTLLVRVSPIGITELKVNMSESFYKDVYRFFDGVMNSIVPTAYAAQSTIGGKFEFPNTPFAGQNLIVNSKNIYKQGGIGGYLDPMIDTSVDTGWGAGDYEHKIIWQALGSQGVDVSKLNTASKSIERATNISAQTAGGIKVPSMQVNLMCSHVSISVGDDHGNGQGTTSWADGKANIRIIAVQGNQIVFGVVVPTVNTQAGGGFFRASWELMGGYLSLTKMSADPEYTNGNSAYNLTGAKYGVYSDKAATNKVGQLTVQNNTGVTNEIFLKEGTYYVKELPGSATGYEINPNVMAVKVTSGKHTNHKLSGNMVEPTLDDPVPVVVQKSYSEWDEAGKQQGDVPDLAGVKFRVSYYNNLYTSAADAEMHDATASAIFATDADGFLFFSDAEPVDGTSWPYQDASGYNTVPLGTVVIREVSSLDGMFVSSRVQAFTITDSGDHVTPKVTPIGTWPEQSVDEDAVGSFANDIWRGGVSVSKADAESNTQVPQGDGSLLGVEYTIYNKSEHSVSVNDEEYQPNEAVMKIYTEELGDNGEAIATTGNNVLPYGTYTITETAGTTSYNNAGWSQTFEIRSDGQMVSYGSAAANWNKNLVKRGGMYIVKADEDTGASVPQGDAELSNTSYDIYNRSAERVFVNGAWFNPNAKIMTVQTSWNDAYDAYVAMTGEHVLPYGTYEIVEVGAPIGYHKADYSHTFSIRGEGEMVALKDAASEYNVDAVFRGGVFVTKADADLHESVAQGDATLKDTRYDIVNKSANAVYVKNKLYQPGETVLTLSTKWNEERQAYVAHTDAHTLPYGTYDIVEVSASEGYLNAEWKQTFTIRQEGEVHYFDNGVTDTEHEYEFHHGWNENAVQRGGVTVGKVDRETGQYISLGEAHLDGATFEIVNKSKAAVYVNGAVYQPNDVIMTIATQEVERDGKTIYAATTGDRVLPYGTYELHEVASGKGYLFDSTSKAYTKTFQIRSDGHMVDLTDEGDAVANQVIREDWHFQKKAEDSMERMNQIAFLVTSQTTGEKHVIVTDENGTWGSAWNNHTNNTNANDPTAPNTNGAMAVDEDGNWYVKDSSKLDFEAGTWFTGMSPDMTQWNEDGTSYVVNGQTVSVNDDLRAFPYDTYTVQELRCDNNVGYKLVNFTVTLHRYTADHDGPGLDIDYGTIDDKAIAIGTTLTYGASDKVAPAAEDVVLRDTITYDNLDVNASYVMKGELHLVEADGSDGGVIATAEKSFNSGIGTGRMTMEFNVDTSELGGRSLVAYEYLTQDGGVIAEHEDITDENQTVVVPEIGTTLTGDIDHQANGSASEITLTDTVSYKNLEVGKQYTMTGTLMDKETGEPVLDANGKAITAQTSFAPVSEKGTVDVVFVFSGVDMSGKTVVAFEEVFLNNTTYAVHADIDDEEQTVRFPSVDTKAVDEVDGNHEIAEAADQTIVDTVSFTNLDKDYDYYVIGELHVRNADGTDGGLLTDAEGNPYKVKSDTFSGSTGNRDGIQLVFEDVDASALGGKDIVVYDTLYTVGAGPRSADGIVLGIHADINDADQTVHVPHIGTTLVTDMDIHEVQVPTDGDTTVTLTDTVSYKNLTPGVEYVMNGTLHLTDVDEEGNVIDGGDTGVTASATFTPEEKNGTVDVTFEFDAKDFAGKSLVAFENVARVYDGEAGQVVAEHADASDEGQTVHFVDMGTTLNTDNGLQETQVPADGTYPVHLTDTIAYKNLIVGHEYTVTGTLHVRNADGTDGGEVKDAEGNVVTSTATFTPTTSNGTVEVNFDFVGTELHDQTIVAFESMSYDGKTFATHADISDESQTVRFVDIQTTAKADNGLHETQVPSDDDKTVTLTDTVAYENLTPGTEYTVTGTLHVQSVAEDGAISDAGVLQDADGEDITATATFTPETADGTVDVEFTFDASGLNGKTVVAFETLSKNDVMVAVHADIEDEGQTVRFVTVDTTLTSAGLTASEDGKGIHEIQVPAGDDKTVTVKDTVAYDNLIAGNEYTLNGSLHVRGADLFGNVKDEGVLKDADGKDVVATTTFTAEASSGTVDVEFTFNADGLTGKNFVAFETMVRGDALIAEHADINDANQTIQFVDMGTTALDKATENHMMAKDETVTIIDTVSYENLIVGHSYKVEGTLHVQSMDEDGNITDGGVLKDADGNEVKASAEFVPEAPNGTVDVTFEFKAKAGTLDGTTVVAFEDMYHEGVLFATHSDITDELQAVHSLKVGTTLTGADKKSKDIQIGSKVDLVDTVAFENLVPGETYTIVGKLVDGNGDAVYYNGKAVEVTSEFTPKDSDGTVEVVFSLDSSKMKDGDKVVAFEYIYSGDTLIGSHEDLKDEAQTVTVKAESDTPKDHVDLQTGVDNFAMPIAIGMLIIVACGGAYFVYRRRKDLE